LKSRLYVFSRGAQMANQSFLSSVVPEKMQN
jgi:hypothetical protein